MKFLTAIIAASLFGFNVAAQETTTSTTEIKNEAKTTTDKADELITNRRFRAQNGSLSPLSVNMALSYSGGALSNPFSADRPNIVGAGDTALVSGMSGTISGSYRLTKVDRIGVGFGIQMLAPFHSSIDTQDARAEAEFNKNQGKLDASNPSVSYTRMANFFGVQTVMSGGITKYTAGNFTDAGYDYNLSASINTMYNFGGSAFSVGLLSVFDRNIFNDDSASLLRFQNETVFGFLPQAEYVINDTFNLRTIIRPLWYQNNRENSTFTNREVTQSVGLGISLSRDIFLYPNFQFAYKNIDLDNTNVGITANINMF